MCTNTAMLDESMKSSPAQSSAKLIDGRAAQPRGAGLGPLVSDNRAAA
jgi:hypothetical protein